MSDRKIEILAPAGSCDAFRAALRAGADAVYAGGNRFGARAFADNFSEDELIQAIREAHLHGRKLYLTVNTLLREDEIKSLYEYLKPYYVNGLDAVIVQDLGVADYIRKYFPDLDIHASTQMTITDAYGARFAQSLGMTRVVPARELSLREIREIRERTGLEIECFVHGALCYCYSGQCLLSSMIGGRSGNRGQCAQPCRLPYTFAAASAQGQQYYLSAKDICTLDLIPEMIEAGIDSFKIEGRMKNPQYVAGVTAMYRKYADLYLASGKENFHVQQEDREALMDLYNRGGFTDGYYHTRSGWKMISLTRPNHAGVPAARIRCQRGREVEACALTDLSAGDVLEISGEKNDHTLGSAVKKGNTFTFLVRRQVRLKSGSTLRRIRNGSLLKQINDEMISRPLQRSVDGKLSLKIGQPAVLRVTAGKFDYEAGSDAPVQAALNRPLTRERICEQMNKTGTSDFRFDRLSVVMDENIFVPVQMLSELRRSAFAGLKEKILASYMRMAKDLPGTGAESKKTDLNMGGSDRGCMKIAVYTETCEQLKAAADFINGSGQTPARLYLGTSVLTGYDPEQRNHTRRCVDIFRAKGTEIIAALPYVLRSTEYPVLDRLMEEAEDLETDGFLLRNCGEYQLLKERGFDKKMILDHNLYVFNSYAADFWEERGIRDLTAPLEADDREDAYVRTGIPEMEIYGAEPVMVSAQCLFKTAGQCRKDSRISDLTDRFGNHFPVRAHCDFCYNVIYNRRPRHLHPDENLTRCGGRTVYRIRFSSESPEQVRKIMSEYLS